MVFHSVKAKVGAYKNIVLYPMQIHSKIKQMFQKARNFNTQLDIISQKHIRRKGVVGAYITSVSKSVPNYTSTMLSKVEKLSFK